MKGKKRGEKADEFEVENIVAHKREGDLDLFKVRWKGFEEADDTWEVEANLVGAPLFHSVMQELKRQSEEKGVKEVKEMKENSQASARKRRRALQTQGDPSRPCGGDAVAADEDDSCEYRIYATGTKVPRNHLPDEVALGNRLSIVRFKRTGNDSRATCDKNGTEDGHDITVTYVIDGQHVYTIPFNAARRYCCQSLLSYLVRRTTFRAPRPSPDATAAPQRGTAGKPTDGGAQGCFLAPEERVAPKQSPALSLDGAVAAAGGVSSSSSDGGMAANESSMGSMHSQGADAHESYSVVKDAEGSGQRAPPVSEMRLVATP